MIETIVSIFLGAAITLLVSRHYYMRASDELRAEAQCLHRQTQLILVSLEQAGLVALERHGSEIVGFKEWRIRTQGLQSTTEFGKADVGNASVV